VIKYSSGIFLSSLQYTILNIFKAKKKDASSVTLATYPLINCGMHVTEQQCSWYAHPITTGDWFQVNLKDLLRTDRYYKYNNIHRHIHQQFKRTSP